MSAAPPPGLSTRRRLFFSLVLVAGLGIADVAAGRLTWLAILWTLRPSAEQAADRQRDFRIAHDIYHHDLLPNYDGWGWWGPVRYRMRTNSLGFRDVSTREVPLRSDTPRVLLLGDSFTEGLGVDYESSMAQQVTDWYAARGVEVLNAGVVTYAPVIYWKKVEDLLEQRRLEVDEVIVFLDISDIQDEAWFYRLSRDGRVIDAPPPSSTALDYWFRNSFTYRTVTRTIRGVWPHPPLNGCGFPDASMSECQAGWTQSPAVRRRFGADGLMRATGHMTELASLLRRHGLPLTVVVYPWPDHLRWQDRNSLQIRHWRRWATDENARFVELFSHFFEASDRIGVKNVLARYFIPGDVHWTVEGNRLAADGVIRQLGVSTPHTGKY